MAAIVQLDQDRVRAALDEYTAEHDRIAEAECRDLEDLIESLVGREARFTARIVVEEHANERLRSIQADSAWERRRALSRLRDRLR